MGDERMSVSSRAGVILCLATAWMGCGGRELPVPQGGDLACQNRLPVSGQTVSWPLPSTTQIGGGWNSLLTNAAGNCIASAVTRTLDGVPAGRVESFKFYMVEEASHLRESLSLSASASYNSGIYSADATASYARDRHVSSYSTYLVLESSVRFPEQTLAHFAIEEDRLAILARSPSAFVGACGDHFVASVVRGGVFRVVFRFNGLSGRDRHEMSASLGGSAGFVSGSASMASTLETFRSRYETSITVFRGGAPAAPFSGSLAELIDEGRRFVATVTPETAVPVEVGTKSYYNADNFPACAALPDYQDEFRAIDAVARAGDDARVAINDLTTRIAMGGRLVEPACDATLAAVNTRLADLRAYQLQLQHVFDACARVEQSCVVPSPVDISMPRIPAECGPTCAVGDGATDASDSLGYCTRCEWRVPGPISVNHNSTGFNNACHFMRPHARTMARLRVSAASVDGHDIGRNIWSWMDVSLAMSGDGVSTCPVPGSDGTCTFSSARGGIYSIGTLSNHVRALAGDSTAYIYAARCTSAGDQRCSFSNVVLQICDESADEAIGCRTLDLPPTPDGGTRETARVRRRGDR